MRIAFLAPEFYHAWGGVGSYSLALIKGLMRLPGIEVHVITPDINDSARKDEIDAIYKPHVQIHTLSVARDTFLYNFKFQAALLFGFRKLHKRYRFDLIHAANLVHLPDIFLKFCNLQLPSIVTVHTTIKGQVQGTRLSKTPFWRLARSEQLSFLTYPYIRLMEKLYLARTDRAITVSERYRRILQKSFGFQGPIDTIHNSIDLSVYAPLKKKQADCKKRFSLQTDKPVILFAGRLIALKGIDILFKAIKSLEDAGEHYTYILAGRGEQDFLDRLTKRCGVRHADIRYLGHVDNSLLPCLYQRADLFVLPSFTENLPITIMEAMASSCVPIASDVGSVHELISDGKDGLLLPPGNARKLAAGLKVLANNRGLRRKLAKSGRMKAKSFDLAIMAKKTKAIYTRMLQG